MERSQPTKVRFLLNHSSLSFLLSHLPTNAVNIPRLDFPRNLHKKQLNIIPIMYGLIRVQGWSYKICVSAKSLFKSIMVVNGSDEFLSKLNT